MLANYPKGGMPNDSLCSLWWLTNIKVDEIRRMQACRKAPGGEQTVLMFEVVKSGLRCWCFSVIWALAIGFSAGSVADPRSGSELANLVLQDCGSCHGMTLKGGLGPALRPENLEQRSVDAIAAIIREGVPQTAMPPWKPLLTPEEIEWISQQLKAGSLVSN